MLMRPIPPRARGFTLIEALIAILVLAIGLLGLAKLQVGSRQYEMESYQRAQAIVLLEDMVNRLSANRKVATCYALTTDNTNGAPWLGKGASAIPTCVDGSTTQSATANNDLAQWDQWLKGASEIASNGDNIGAMIGARGCVFYDAVNDEYVVTVAWQGLLKTAAPAAAISCGKNQYGDEAQRRTVSAVVRIASLI